MYFITNVTKYYQVLMHFVTGQAVIQSSYCVIGNTTLQIAISSCNDALCFVLRKLGSSTMLRIHYHRISYLSICKKLLST